MCFFVFDSFLNFFWILSSCSMYFCDDLLVLFLIVYYRVDEFFDCGCGYGWFVFGFNSSFLDFVVDVR